MGDKSDFVVIVAPCPAAIPAVEGWMSRIHMVDTIFMSSRRVYIDPISGVYGFEDAREKKHNRLVSEYRVDLQIPQHRKLVEDLILRARLVYIHTCHLARYFLPYYATGKIITDIHGIVPEEEELQNRPDHALFYEGVERVVLTNSRKLVVVTEAMKQHLLTSIRIRTLNSWLCRSSRAIHKITSPGRNGRKAQDTGQYTQVAFRRGRTLKRLSSCARRRMPFVILSF